MPPVLTYALLAFCAAVFLFSFAVDYVKRPAVARLRRYSGWMTVVAMGAAYLLLRPGRGEDGAQALRTSAASGQPLFLEFFSNR